MLEGEAKNETFSETQTLPISCNFMGFLLFYRWANMSHLFGSQRESNSFPPASKDNVLTTGPTAISAALSYFLSHHLSVVKKTGRERPKSAPYLRLKNSKRTSKYSLLQYPHKERNLKIFISFFFHFFGPREVA